MSKYTQLLQRMMHQMLAADHQRVGQLQQALALMEHPDHLVKVIHIAGTNGKGSTGAMLAAILKESGATVGHFSSPALLTPREQIKLNDHLISEAAFVRTLERIRQQVRPLFDLASFTEFEWFFLVALRYFADEGAQWVVLEAGLGGRDDATNAIAPPLLTVFTHIALDHVAILGDTLTAIAQNKAAIIKPGTTVVVAPRQAPVVQTVLMESAQQHGAVAYLSTTPVQLSVLRRTLTTMTVQVTSQSLRQELVTIGLIGDYQLDNLRTVMTVFDWLVAHEEVVITALGGLATVVLPGRLQVYQQHPLVLLDGAHNVDATTRLLQSLRQIVADRPLIFVLGILADKDVPTMAREYAATQASVIAVTPNHPTRALDGAQLARLIPGSQVAATSRDGLALAQQQADAQTVIVVTGSFSTIAELEEGK